MSAIWKSVRAIRLALQRRAANEVQIQKNLDDIDEMLWMSAPDGVKNSVVSLRRQNDELKAAIDEETPRIKKSVLVMGETVKFEKNGLKKTASFVPSGYKVVDRDGLMAYASEHPEVMEFIGERDAYVRI